MFAIRARAITFEFWRLVQAINSGREDYVTRGHRPDQTPINTHAVLPHRGLGVGLRVCADRAVATLGALATKPLNPFLRWLDAISRHDSTENAKLRLSTGGRSLNGAAQKITKVRILLNEKLETYRSRGGHPYGRHFMDDGRRS